MITLINIWPQIFNFLMKTLEIYSLSNTEIYIQLFLYLACCASDLKKKKITLIPPEALYPLTISQFWEHFSQIWGTA